MSLERMHSSVKISIILTLICLNVLIRIPIVDHEFGVDSFFIHAMAESLNINGRAFWILDISSYFGIYPFSYPSAAPFLLSSVSQLSGLDIGHSILALSFFLAIFSMLTAYMFASIFFKNDSMKILIGLFYTTTPLMIKYTYWTFSSRSLLLALMPLILWMIFKPFSTEISNIPNGAAFKSTQEYKGPVLKKIGHKIANSFEGTNRTFIILAVLMIIIAFTIHYSAWIIAALIVLFIIIKLILFFTHVFRQDTERKMNVRGIEVNKNYKLAMGCLYSIFIMTTILLILILFNLSFYNDISSQYFTKRILGEPLTIFIWVGLGLLSMMLFLILTRYYDENGEAVIPIRHKILFSSTMFMLVSAGFIHIISSVNDHSILIWMNLEGLDPGTIKSTDYSPVETLRSLGMIVIGRFGVLLAISMIGILSIFFIGTDSIKSWKKWFLLNSMLLIFPFMALAPYPLEFSSILISIFAGYGLIEILKRLHPITGKTVVRITVCFFLIGIISFSNYTITYRVNNEFENTGDKNYLDDDFIELAAFISVNLNNNSFLDLDTVKTTRLSAVTGKDSRYIHDFQYLTWHDIEFYEFNVTGIELDTDSFYDLFRSVNRPYNYEIQFSIPRIEYLITPEGYRKDVNLTSYPDYKVRFYRIYSNERSTIWLLNDESGHLIKMRSP